MRLSHRLLATALALLCAAQVAPASAQTAFPNQPLKFVIAFGPGGVADSTARIVAEKLGDKLGQRVVVENNPGGGGIAAARAVIAAPADGHTLALLTNGTSISVSLFKSLPFDPVKDFTPVSKLGAFEFFVIAKADGPHTTLGDFLKAAKANPGKLNVGSVNPGSTQHLSTLLLKATSGVDYQWVPFKTTPDIVVALLRGDLDAAVDGAAAVRGNVEDGKLRLLASSAPTRGPLFPNVPTVKEAGGGDFDVMSWNGMFVKAGTPAPIVAQLNKAVREALADETVRTKLLGVGIVPDPTSSDEMGAFLKADIAKWAKVIEDNKIERR